MSSKTPNGGFTASDRRLHLGTLKMYRDFVQDTNSTKYEVASRYLCFSQLFIALLQHGQEIRLDTEIRQLHLVSIILSPTIADGAQVIWIWIWTLILMVIFFP